MLSRSSIKSSELIRDSEHYVTANSIHHFSSTLSNWRMKKQLTERQLDP